MIKRYDSKKKQLVELRFKIQKENIWNHMNQSHGMSLKKRNKRGMTKKKDSIVA